MMDIDEFNTSEFLHKHDPETAIQKIKAKMVMWYQQAWQVDLNALGHTRMYEKARIVYLGLCANHKFEHEMPHKLTRRPVQSDLWVRLGKGSFKPNTPSDGLLFSDSAKDAMAESIGAATRFTVEEVAEAVTLMAESSAKILADDPEDDPEDEPEGYQENPYFYQEAVPIHRYLASELRRDRFDPDPVQFAVIAFNPEKLTSTEIANLICNGREPQFILRSFPKKTYSE